MLPRKQPVPLYFPTPPTLHSLRGVQWPRKLNVTLAQLLYEATPWARFIVLMRDPVARYYSAFYY